MIQGEKHVWMRKITDFGRFRAEMTLLCPFFSSSPACKVVKHENLLQAESIRNRVSTFLVVKKHWNHYQVPYRMIVVKGATLSLRWKTKDRLDFYISEFTMSELTDLSVSEEFSRGADCCGKRSPIVPKPT
jgi:hypothetical protein